MDMGPNGEEPKSWEDFYNFNLMPSELILKFRKEMEGLRVGVNLQFCNEPVNDFESKFVLKPLSPSRRWKFMYEPVHGDIRLLSKKIPVTDFLNLQVGIGYNYQLRAASWKWKLGTCLGGDGISRIRNKTTIGLRPGVDLRFGWRVDYVLPEITGALGTGESLFNMHSGRLHASLDRVEGILTHGSAYLSKNQDLLENEKPQPHYGMPNLPKQPHDGMPNLPKQPYDVMPNLPKMEVHRSSMVSNL